MHRSSKKAAVLRWPHLWTFDENKIWLPVCVLLCTLALRVSKSLVVSYLLVKCLHPRPSQLAWPQVHVILSSDTHYDNVLFLKTGSCCTAQAASELNYTKTHGLDVATGQNYDIVVVLRENDWNAEIIELVRGCTTVSAQVQQPIEEQPKLDQKQPT